jgi:diguanylate cyclase (GGDEF)-like protein
MDVSLVSLCLASYFVFGKPQTAVNSKVVFEVYFLAIGCASLRYDWRVCATSGALATLQYAAIVTYAWNNFEFFGAVGADSAFGWNIQVGRMIVLTAAAVISVAAVLRAQRLRQLSTTDRLTGTANRGFFDQRLAEEESRARRYGHPFSVALVDVDHFKRFNDSHGHVAGDLALQTLAETLRGSVRKSDLVARYGGEEFALILPETGLEEAARKMELMRRLVAAAEIEIDPTLIVKIDVSVGVAAYPRDGADGRAVLAAADTRLYEAKRAGRGRVIAGLQRFST